MDMVPASMSTVRRTLDGALLQVNEAFCDEHPLNGKAQSHDRRVKLAMQIYLRLWLLIASKGDMLYVALWTCCTQQHMQPAAPHQGPMRECNILAICCMVCTGQWIAMLSPFILYMVLIPC